MYRLLDFFRYQSESNYHAKMFKCHWLIIVHKQRHLLNSNRETRTIDMIRTGIWFPAVFQHIYYNREFIRYIRSKKTMQLRFTYLNGIKKIHLIHACSPIVE